MSAEEDLRLCTSPEYRVPPRPPPPSWGREGQLILSSYWTVRGRGWAGVLQFGLRIRLASNDDICLVFLFLRCFIVPGGRAE
jgi:hypothetical protein